MEIWRKRHIERKRETCKFVTTARPGIEVKMEISPFINSDGSFSCLLQENEAHKLIENKIMH